MAESKQVRTRKVSRQSTRRPRIEAGSGILEVEFPPELLNKAMAAAKASGQTPSEWICEAVTEAIERKSKGARSKVGYNH